MIERVEAALGLRPRAAWRVPWTLLIFLATLTLPWVGSRYDTFIGTQIALPLVQEGKLRALAVTGKERWKGMPDVPTMQEQGFKDFNVVNWFGTWLPAGATPAIVSKLQSEIAKTLQEPDIQKEFDTLGLRSVGSSPEEFARFVEKDAHVAREIARRIEGRKK